MFSSATTLFQLLRSALGRQSAETLSTDIDWQKLIDLSYDQGVAAIAVDGLQKKVRGESFGSTPSTSSGTSSPTENEGLLHF